MRGEHWGLSEEFSFKSCQREGLRFLLGSLPDLSDLHPRLQGRHPFEGPQAGKALDEQLCLELIASALSRNCSTWLRSTLI